MSIPKGSIMSIVIHLRRQQGLITRQQALAGGLTRHQIQGHLSRGTWHKIHRGVYWTSPLALDWQTRLWAAVLAVNGAASFRCAAALWGLGLFAEPAIEVSSHQPRSHRAPVGVTVHYPGYLPSHQLAARRGIPCTSIERTLFDCASVLSDNSTERLIESAVRQRLTEFTDLTEFVGSHSRRGRPGSTSLRRILDQRAAGPVTLSDFSELVAQLIRNTGLEPPELEYRIVDDRGRFIMQADLAWPRLRKAIELDGLEWHFGRADVERDRRKRAKARSEGWRILEILWSMYATERAELTSTITRFLGAI